MSDSGSAAEPASSRCTVEVCTRHHQVRAAATTRYLIEAVLCHGDSITQLRREVLEQELLGNRDPLLALEPLLDALDRLLGLHLHLNCLAKKRHTRTGAAMVPCCAPPCKCGSCRRPFLSAQTPLGSRA